MVLRVLEYFVRFWADLVRATPALPAPPPVVCVIVHHGELGWTTPRRLHELIEGLDLVPDRIEPRARYPAKAPCARPRVPVRGRCGAKVRLIVSHPDGAPHLPVVRLRRAA